MLKQNIQQKLGLKINPLQIQLIKLLELPTVQMEQRVKEALEENPLLEEGEEVESEEQQSPEDSYEEEENDKETDEFSLEDYMSDDEIPEYRLTASNSSKDDEGRGYVISQSRSFRESLIAQLGIHDLDETQQRIAEYVIGNIDDDGYLRRDAEQIADDLAFSLGLTVSESEVEDSVKLVQGFEPPGIGARNLRECLLLQLNRKSAGGGNPALYDARRILDECFEQFARKHYEKIEKKLRLTEEELKAAVAEILKLNPKPGGTDINGMQYGEAEKIIPDFNLDIVDGELQLTLNSGNIPNLRINKSYLNMLEKYRDKEGSKEKRDVISFVKYKLNAAKSFIDAVEQRNNTLMLTMTAIVQYQKDFFTTGNDNYLKPVILKDISDVTGLDVSTVSRVSNSKYVQTWFGIYSLKDFFTGSIKMSGGKEVSTGKLRNELKSIVDKEDKQNPYTDDQLVDMMKETGYKIARRTVVKYRNMLGIPVARLRKEL